MNIRTQICIAAAAIIAIVCIVGTLWSNHKIARLEHDVENAKTLAAEKQNTADEKEKIAGEYKAKNEYLEQQIDALRAVAQKQDEELQELSANVDNARADVSRTRSVRSAATTLTELCTKLADLGHGCG
jgi:predicted RNase H-like nuclease (RuvC/YqgF family)